MRLLCTPFWYLLIPLLCLQASIGSIDINLIFVQVFGKLGVQKSFLVEIKMVMSRVVSLTIAVSIFS